MTKNDIVKNASSIVESTIVGMDIYPPPVTYIKYKKGKLANDNASGRQD
jgi:hypothetical protein